MTTSDITRQQLPRPTRPAKLERQAEHAGGRLAVMGVAAVSIGCLAAVMYAAISGISNWSEVVVLAGIALATVGLMIAIDPLRRDP
jgi:hypothetical protein